MGWLTDLLQHLRITRSAVVALFIACFVLIVGPYYYPDAIRRVPESWTWVLQGVLAFTTVLLLIWASAAVGGVLSNWYQSLSRAVAVRNITVLEEALLGMLAQNPNEPLQLDELNYARQSFSKLQAIEAADGLQRKGLAERSHAHSDTVWITLAGRKRVLNLQSQSDAKDGG